MDIITLALAKKYANKKFNEVVKFGGFEIVDSLPTTGISRSTVYLLHEYSAEGDVYLEYIYTAKNEWEKLGTTVDLAGYLTQDDLQAAIESALAQAKESGDFDGADGKTPYIQNGYWYIGGSSTGVKAAGEDGATPYIQDGYWYINGTNTNVRAKGEDGSDYVLTAADKAEIANQISIPHLYKHRIYFSWKSTSDKRVHFFIEAILTTSASLAITSGTIGTDTSRQALYQNFINTLFTTSPTPISGSFYGDASYYSNGLYPATLTVFNATGAKIATDDENSGYNMLCIMADPVDRTSIDQCGATVMHINYNTSGTVVVTDQVIQLI